MIEKTPIFNVTKETFDLLLDNDLKPLFNKINTEYLYWDKVKYLAPKGVRPENQGDRFCFNLQTKGKKNRTF